MDDFSRAVSELLLAGKKVVIDEFQRLPESVIERIEGKSGCILPVSIDLTVV